MATVIFDRNYENSIVSSKNVNIGDSVEFMDIDRDGYYFLGWSTVKSIGSNTKLYREGDSFIISTSNTIRFYAQWTTNFYYIFYNLNGGSGSISQQKFSPGKRVTLRSDIPTRSGYKFKGWGRYSEASSSLYYAGSSVTFNDEQNVILYAHWAARITVTFDLNGGSGNFSSITSYSGIAFTLPSMEPTRGGYAFLGWSLISTMSFGSYNAGDSITLTSTCTLYAVWGYYITYYSNGALFRQETQMKNVTHYVYTEKPVRNGYTFLGWTDSVGGTSPSYQPGDTMGKINSGITLWALWEKNNMGKFYWRNSDEEDNVFFISKSHKVSNAITATAWNKMLNKIETIYNANHPSSEQLSLTRVNSGNPIRALDFNTARENIQKLSGYNSIVNEVRSGSILYPGYFNGTYDGKNSLKTALNNAIEYFNNN